MTFDSSENPKKGLLSAQYSVPRSMVEHGGSGYQGTSANSQKETLKSF